MRMNRRNVLVGLGTIVAGGGAALGTGAFSSVEADRTVDLGVNDDSSALLKIAEHSEGSAIVGTEDGGDATVLTLDEQSLNENATTRFNQAITITNDGTQDVGFFVADSGAASSVELDIEESGGSSIVGSGSAVDLSANGGNIDLNVVIDLTGGNSVGNITGDITFEADESEHSTP
ncbi:hypothetical protein [Natronorubrum sp. DTA7]|uniref:hypothetical protein n=1 Tax=Natronorubrum sp. DTA7 TaxID=3447016 RepID=UPI003F833708